MDPQELAGSACSSKRLRPVQPISWEATMRQFGRRDFIQGLACGFGGLLLASGTFALAAESTAVDEKSVLIVVDVQNCFLPGGSLAVKDGEQVVPIINRIAQKFAHVVLTQDWHTPGHISYAVFCLKKKKRSCT